jgi:hypothetical protein
VGGLAALQAGRAARIAAARSAWAEALAQHPGKIDDYVVSFAAPVYLAKFLATAAGSSGLTLGTLHLWLNDDRSVFPIVGEARYADLPKAPDDAIAALTKRYDPILAREVAQAKTNSRRAGTENKARAEREHRYIVAAREDLNANGPRLYGFTCACSPAAVERLVMASGAVIRLVEQTGARAANDRPMYPYDRQLEQALARSSA